VPEAAIPRPTPAKITPPTMPRFAGEVCGRIVEAASTMMTPPARPDRKRQTKNQVNETGAEHAKQESVARTIITRKAHVGPIRAATARASNAPAR
jgi:hypothetical protein